MALRDGSEAGTQLGDGLALAGFGTKPGVIPVDSAVTLISFGNQVITLGGATASVQYVNRVYDPGGPMYVSWLTYTAPDTLGIAYPDPYGNGFGGCSGFHVAGVISV
jgi:hypothetical protein